jgi:hypothetical protein
MPDFQSSAKRLVVAAGLAAAVVGVTALGGTAARADPPRPVPVAVGTFTQTISALRVQAGGTEATVSFTTAEPTLVSIDHKRAGTTATLPSQLLGTRPLDAVRAPLAGGAVATAGVTAPLTTYKTAHQIPLKNLESNTTYDVSVVATTQSGEQLRAQTQFTTHKQRVRITLESINVRDDGDLIGDGEPLWFVEHTWSGGRPGRPGTSPSYPRPLCYPNTYGRCEYRDFDEGRITPRSTTGEPLTVVFAEENFDRFPTTVGLRIWAKEDDAIGGAWIIECLSDGCPVGEDTVRHEWNVPQGVESASQRVTLRGDDSSTGFESELTFHFEMFHDDKPYPWHSRNLPSNTWFPGVPAQ